MAALLGLWKVGCAVEGRVCSILSVTLGGELDVAARV